MQTVVLYTRQIFSLAIRQQTQTENNLFGLANRLRIAKETSTLPLYWQ